MRQNLFRPRPGAQYLAFNKPYGVLCQFTQPTDSDKRTLKEFDFPENVYTVGRLDFDSEGLIVLSDDGRLNDALLNPRQQHFRTYLAQVENVPTPKAIEELQAGVVIENRLTAPAKAELLLDEPLVWQREIPIRVRKSIPTSWIKLSIFEGRNRQVRKMTAAVGCPTLRLIRAAIGDLNLAELALGPGQWVALSEEHLLKLFDNR
jgi:23S rRNA pseudouridine2457 synthase